MPTTIISWHAYNSGDLYIYTIVQNNFPNLSLLTFYLQMIHDQIQFAMELSDGLQRGFLSLNLSRIAPAGLTGFEILHHLFH